MIDLLTSPAHLNFRENNFETTFIDFDLDVLRNCIGGFDLDNPYDRSLMAYWENPRRKSRMTIRELQLTMTPVPGLGQTDLVEMMHDDGVIKISEDQPIEKDLQVLKNTDLDAKYTLIYVDGGTNMLTYEDVKISRIDLIQYAQYPCAVRVTYRRKRAQRDSEIYLKTSDRHSSKAMLVPGWKRDEAMSTISNPVIRDGDVKVSHMLNRHASCFSTLAERYGNQATWIYR